MTQEQKDLLLQDLCARLPYGVRLDNGLKLRSIDVLTQIVSCSGSDRKIDYVKPYLRPMSSMTEEELHEVQEILGKGVEIHDVFISIVDSSINTFSYLELQAVFDWLNKKMFDYRGLISMGLALEALEGMYNLK